MITDEQRLLRRWADTWRDAQPELEAIRRRESAAIPAQEAIRQVFDGMERAFSGPVRVTSGLTEQQMWFSRIRNAALERDPSTDGA